jgi:hypothetical protein
MKKFTLKLLSLMLVCIIMLPLIMACGDETDPDEVSEVERFEAMTESEKAFYILEDISYDNGSGKTGANMTLSINGNYMGYAYTVSAVAEKLMVDNSQEFKDYTETTITITMAGMSEVSRSKSGWIDGKQFMYTELDGNGNGDGIYTEMSKEDYLKTQEEASGNYSDNFGITKDSCTTVTCTKNAQGNWVATFTGIAEDSLADFKDLLLGFEPMIDASTLTDITLTLTISANLVPVSMSVDFEFSGSNPPVVELEYDIFYGDEVVVPSIDLSGYEKVDSSDLNGSTNV